MDFNKLSQQASGFMNKQNDSSNQGSANPNMNTNTGGTSNMGSDQGMSSNQGMGGANTGMAGTNTNTNTNTNTGNEDYGDKGLDFIEKKTGHTFTRDQNEKITDGARGMFEKFSGKQVDPKYSN